MKERFLKILSAARVFNENSIYLSSICHSADFIHLNKDKMSNSERKELLQIAKDWGGEIKSHWTKEKDRGKWKTTTYWILSFGDSDIKFKLQLAHYTSVSHLKGLDLITHNWAKSLFSDGEPELGYHNGGMLRFAREIGIPIIDLVEQDKWPR